MKHVPKVSVVMPVYNEEKYLSEAIDSILNQTFKDFEFIVINDGSTDRTQEIIQSYRDHRIILIQQEQMGLTKSLNKGIALAKGEYIARHDADDITTRQLEKINWLFWKDIRILLSLAVPSKLLIKKPENL